MFRYEKFYENDYNLRKNNYFAGVTYDWLLNNESNMTDAKVLDNRFRE